MKNGYADSATRSKMKSTFFSIVSCMLIFEALWEELKFGNMREGKIMEVLLGSAHSKDVAEACIGQFIINARKSREIFLGLL